MTFLKKTSIALLALLLSTSIHAQLAERVLVGYWENWNANFIKIADLDERYNVIVLAFFEADINNNANDNIVDDNGSDMLKRITRY